LVVNSSEEDEEKAKLDGIENDFEPECDFKDKVALEQKVYNCWYSHQTIFCHDRNVNFLLQTNLFVCQELQWIVRKVFAFL